MLIFQYDPIKSLKYVFHFPSANLFLKGEILYKRVSLSPERRVEIDVIEKPENSERKARVSESDEKRLFPRARATIPVSGRCLGHRLKRLPFHGETRDISLNGLCIEVDEAGGFSAGQRVKFQIQRYEEDGAIKVKGRVCWVHARDNTTLPIHMGVMLIKARPYHRWFREVEKELFLNSPG